ncbi:MAG: sigma-54-dependent Fis family transcriptional regulator [Planctomycetes bacterium]|nr:sigma-54-dependent Fis family transcriptional regulator [Planctomycetota bacterium]
MPPDLPRDPSPTAPAGTASDPTAARVLAIDDDPAFLRIVGALLARHGVRVDTATDVVTALARAPTFDPDVVLLDRELGSSDGLDHLPELRRAVPTAPVVVVTAHDEVAEVVRSMRAGAFDFLGKPLDEARLVACLSTALAHGRLLREVEALRSSGDDVGAEELLGTSPSVRAVRDLLTLAAPTDATMLLLGEPGTGKEVVARAIHRRSARAKGPFVALALTAVPREQVAAALFGEEGGNGPEADGRREGAVARATGGTLYLEEVMAIPLDVQADLLRVLEDRTFRRVGGHQVQRADVRLVATSAHDLVEATRSGRMRLDLYYRLAVAPVRLPPLRERRADVPLLVARMLRELATAHGRSFASVAPDAMARLGAASWPGNVRQLRHVIERAVVLHAGPVLEASMLPEDLDLDPTPATSEAGDAPGKDAGDETVPLATLEREAIERAVAKYRSPAVAAQHLGLSTATIYRRLAEYRRDGSPPPSAETGPE